MCEICYSKTDKCVINNDYSYYDISNITNCTDIKYINLSIYSGTDYLYIDNCPNLVSINIVNNLSDLYIYNCPKLENITFNFDDYFSLNKMIINCDKMHYYNNDPDNILKYLSILKITKWYKKKKKLD